MKELLAIFFGGGAGSVLRYLVQQVMHERIVAYDFPWATFAVNVVGSFLIGLFYAMSDRFELSPEFRLLLTAGFCGGFTTFSTFSNDNLELIRQGNWQLALVYILLSVVSGIAACFFGATAIRIR